MKNIIEIAASNPSFSTLVTAVKAAGLVDTLSGAGPFTVFAPTNAAFAKVPAEALAALLADKTKLTSVLTYHVIADEIAAKDIATMTEVKTVQGSKIKIDTHDGVILNNARVIDTDISCSNGVIHSIDRVLMP
ncbi:MAG: hypothetical protein RI996_24 [Candidatus Parcubacteria bacterium]|jgi:uncharacterized surface protein with fasciclin (FAS1) repeats